MAGGIQLHGLVAKNATLPKDAPSHQIVAFETFDALISPYLLPTDIDDLEADVLGAAALNHHHILLGYCAKHALLPMRFGTVFSSPAALGRAMRDKAALYDSALVALENLREYSVHLGKTNTHLEIEPKARDGRAFLNRKQHNRDARRDMAQNQIHFAQMLVAKIEALCAQPVSKATSKPDQLLDVTTLLSPSSLTDLRHLASDVQGRAADLGLSITLKGPWPAYHFDASALEQDRMCHGA